MLKSLTPQFFDTLVVVVLILGMAFAAVRLYADFTRPLPDDPAKRPTPSAAPEQPPADPPR